ncbi:MAG: hypothetical protein M3N95_10640 [Actinomycetota bacterium]|nr:hypothetical protein [Actinomycetota bacterium]
MEPVYRGSEHLDVADRHPRAQKLCDGVGRLDLLGRLVREQHELPAVMSARAWDSRGRTPLDAEHLRFIGFADLVVAQDVDDKPRFVEPGVDQIDI